MTGGGSSGIALIDEQHLGLFKLIAEFEEKYDSSAPVAVMSGFLTQLLAACEAHFESEEALMDLHEFPLAVHHKKQHREFLPEMDRIKQELNSARSGRIYFGSLLEAARAWRRHAETDDPVFFGYMKNKEFRLGGEILGMPCEILTMENRVLAYGTITGITDGEIEIDCGSVFMPFYYNDIVKVALFIQGGEFLCFVSLVYLKQETVVKLLHGAVVKTVNDRDFFRVPIKLDGTISGEGKNSGAMNILDISAGGMRIETGLLLEPGDEAAVSFMLDGADFSLRCAVTRRTRIDAQAYSYGVMFRDIDSATHSALVRIMLRQQALSIKAKKDR